MAHYAFMTKDSFRFEVKASTPKAGYNKLMAIEHLAKNMTKSYIKYDKDGLASMDSWKSI